MTSDTLKFEWRKHLFFSVCIKPPRHYWCLVGMVQLWTILICQWVPYYHKTCFYFEVAWDWVIQKLSSQDVVHQSFLHQRFTQVWFICYSHQILINSWQKKGNARETEIETEMCWWEKLLPVFTAGENTSTDIVKCPLTPDSNCSEFIMFCSFRIVPYSKANHECL